VICLEITVNGERRLLAGAASAKLINASVSLYPGLREGWLEVTGSVAPADQPAAEARWMAAALSAGDVVQVGLIESELPAAPALSRTDPTALASDGIARVCAFCERTSEQAIGMVASRKAMICPECVGYLHEMLHESQSSTEI
jgi:hypothetical protein